ncbi:tetratricopeptide repeat protein [Nonomuraea sp. NPDC003707]
MAVGPRATLRLTHRVAADAAGRHALIGALVVGTAAAVAGGVPDLVSAVSAGALVYGANAGLAAGWGTWVRYRLIHLSLALRGLLPWRLWRFLNDAHRRGILRQAGTVWQFRHILLQDRLTATILQDFLRSRSKSGDVAAIIQLGALLAGRGQIEQALAVLRAHASNPAVAARLSDLLAELGQVEEALVLVRPLAATDFPGAFHRLIDLLTRHGRVDEAIAVLQARAGPGLPFIPDLVIRFGLPSAETLLVDLLAKHGRMEELGARADAGDALAAHRLAGLLAEHGRVEELRVRADAGDGFAADRLGGLLAERGHVEEALALLRDHDDNNTVAERLVDLLAEHGREEELRSRADDGDALAVDRLGGLLAERGQVEEALALLRMHADGGNLHAASRLAELLAEHGRVEELRARIDSGLDTDFAVTRLIELFTKGGLEEEALALARTHDRQQELADLLVASRRLDELRARADAHDFFAGLKLADLRTGPGR